ncbi:type II toxin-antitoxin system PemK/MazF family toxin [Lactobacillus acetotolerans]|jgi:mRNA interferase MazF|uniref:Transcriptional regulator n=1 Tax=Lactobacillus acetotolerans TaxID=1600 RepID=A0A0D6A1B8_9LACO|nr:type II toxin-antitoxin system PemK/MazF family toxin [Lactobacillus acetotolerans]QGV05128.1 type II toxin-antitoxin system PemK/MazF family toxin [Lactobacillus acetotolerans]BAQ56617.1 transcriptional regulator [Lactobacillus acetotolerans]
MNSHKEYIPAQQDLIVIDFDPAIGKEIRKRRPALVMSNAGYSQVTGLVVIALITHATNNRLKNFFVPVVSNKVSGYINPLQFFTYDFRKRNAKKLDLLPTSAFVEVKQVMLNIIA